MHGNSVPSLSTAAFAETAVEWPELQTQWEAWADALTDADTDRVIEYKLLSGAPGASRDLSRGSLLRYDVSSGWRLCQPPPEVGDASGEPGRSHTL